MTHPDYLRDRAREMRADRRLTIDQIAERLDLSRSTIYCWVRDMPIERSNYHAGLKRGPAVMQERFRLPREEAYEEGLAEFDRLSLDPTFRDFVCMYIGEGTKRYRNMVVICNSDPSVVLLGAHWLRRLSRSKIDYQLQFHDDQDLVELVRFWATTLDVDHADIKLQRKSNSNQLAGRTWRSRYGVLSVRTNDTLFRARLQAWMDRVQEDWSPARRESEAGKAPAV